jgi:hypothetical protein
MLIPMLKAAFSPAILSESIAVAEPVGSPRFWWKLIISMLLVLGGGVFAGYAYTLFLQRIV